MDLPYDTLHLIVSYGWPGAMALIPKSKRRKTWARYCHYGRTTHTLVTHSIGPVSSTHIRLYTNGTGHDVYDTTKVFLVGRNKKYTELYDPASIRQRRIVQRLWYCVHDMCVWDARPAARPLFRARMNFGAIDSARTGPGRFWSDTWLPTEYPVLFRC